MRVVQNQQMLLSEVDIAQIKFAPRSRDDIPKVLRGLQHLYMNQALRQKIFALLDKINTLVVKEGHVLVKKGGAALRGQCDSFVVETDVHYPTDITLLLDAMRKAITLTAQWCEAAQRTDFRQYRYQINALKRLVRTAQNKKHRRATSEALPKPDDAVVQAHRTLVERATRQLANIKTTLASLAGGLSDSSQKLAIEGYIQQAEKVF